MRRTMMAMVALLALGSCSDEGRKIGEFCDATGDAFCARMRDCGITTYNACFRDYKGACCVQDGVCEDQLPGNIVVDECVAALPGLSCEDARAGAPPAVCLMSR